MKGLNPLMFIFALIANVAYVGRCISYNPFSFSESFASLSVSLTTIFSAIDCSILIRSTEWDKIKANLPWLLDAIVCVGLDLFVSSSYSFSCCLTFESLCIHKPHPHTTYISDKHSWSMRYLFALLYFNFSIIFLCNFFKSFNVFHYFI